MTFTKTLISWVNVFFLQIKLFIFVSTFKKNNSVKKISFCKKIRSVKQTHSVKDELYFQFSFATNVVLNDT